MYDLIGIKIGSNTILDNKGEFDYEFAYDIAKQIRKLREEGIYSLVTCSGAISLGARMMNIDYEGELEMGQKEALASVGQNYLVSSLSEVFYEENVGRLGQLLVGADDLRNKKRRKNLENTIRNQLEMGIVPVLNENDSVSTEEIEEGDNDKLSAEVGEIAQIKKLFLLSNVSGVYDKDNRVVRVIDSIDDTYELVRDQKSKFGRGGMKSKIEAAKIAASYGAQTHIVDGKEKQIVYRICSGLTQEGTKFLLDLDQRERFNKYESNLVNIES